MSTSSEMMGKCDNTDNDFRLPLKKYGVLGIDDKNKAFCSDHNAPVLFSGKSTIFIFFFTKYVQGARHSSTMAPTSPQSEFPLNDILI
jgi:hypothetical protein